MIKRADTNEHKYKDSDSTNEVTVKSRAARIAEPQLINLAIELASDVEEMTGNGESEAKSHENSQELEKKEEEKDLVGDLLPDHQREVYCNGDCDFDGTNWTNDTIYMCIHCGDCDLCEACYEVHSLHTSQVHIFHRTNISNSSAWHGTEANRTQPGMNGVEKTTCMSKLRSMAGEV